MVYYLNISLLTTQGAVVEVAAAQEALTAQGFAVTDFEVLNANVVPTLVVLVLERGDRRGREVYAAFFRVAEALGQEYISVLSVSVGRGALIGPLAHLWGAFTPDAFYLTDGRALNSTCYT